MVKLDPDIIKYLEANDYRVLTSIEMGMKNHELVPTTLIETISGIRSGCYKILQKLHKAKLILHESKPFDGYTLKYSGYDCLAIRTFIKRGVLTGMGSIIGMGKESDIWEATDADGKQLVIKLHRLGRTSFRRIKEKRDYHRHRKNASWLYLSRLSALTEYSYMKVLPADLLRIPEPIDHNRHAVLMTRVDGVVLNHIKKMNQPNLVYTQCMDMIVKLAEHGIIHCDLNEFNLLIDKKGKLTLIDFPQMVSTNHPHAQELFDRDVKCITTFFGRRFNYASNVLPILSKCEAHTRLDEQVDASGCKNEEERSEEKEESSLEKSEDNESEKTAKIENSENAASELTDDIKEQEDEKIVKKQKRGRRRKKKKPDLTREEITRRVKRESSKRAWMKKLKGSRKSALQKKMKLNAKRDIDDHFA